MPKHKTNVILMKDEGEKEKWEEKVEVLRMNYLKWKRYSVWILIDSCIAKGNWKYCKRRHFAGGKKNADMECNEKK